MDTMDLPLYQHDKRKLSISNILFASFLGASADYGLFSQGSAQLVMPRVARYVIGYLDKQGILPEFGLDPFQNLMILMEFLQNHIGVAEEFSFTDNNQQVEIKADTCKWCPKGVGGSEIRGTACPYPHFLLESVNLVSPGKKITLDTEYGKILDKQEGRCLIRFKPAD